MNVCFAGPNDKHKVSFIFSSSTYMHLASFLSLASQRVQNDVMMQVDANDVPVTKLVIRDAEVLWNPFDDLQPRVDKDDKKAARAEAEALQQQR